MSILEVTNLTHSFGDKILYKNVSFDVFKGEHLGIVGRNGTGKTTLLRSLIGEITPDFGHIKWQKNIKIGYLDQYAKIDQMLTVFEYLKTAFNDLYDIETKLNKVYENMSENFDAEAAYKASNYQSLLTNCGFYEIESTIFKVAYGLGITAIGIDNLLKELSGGQRAKVILAKLLLENPSVLLLDEPTNFLDKEHVDWLTYYLKNFEGTFLVISHNFDFLDNISDCILDIEFQKIMKYNNNFTKFLEVKGSRRESYIQQFQAQQKEIKKHEKYIARNRAGTNAKQAQSRIKKLEKMEILTPPKTSPKPNFKLTSLSVSNQKALKVEGLEIGYDRVLLPKISFEVNAGEKVVITGFNGIGKSTLLKTLTKEISAISGIFKFAEYVRIGYFEQDLFWKNPDINPLEIISEKFPKWSQQEVRKSLAQCGIISKNIIQKIGTLSGGEQSKVKLCVLANTKSNFLILDEPTNHLDADSKEVLRQQLLKWEGNLILVSHEASFYNNLANKIISLKE